MKVECEKRLFIGIPVGWKICPILYDIQSAIAHNSGQIRWVPHDNIHMTLSFLGHVSLDDIPQLIKVFKDTLDFKHFKVSIEKTGVFSFTQHPKILWLGVGRGKQKMIALHEQVEKVVASFKVGRMKEYFSPHITIGRVARLRGKIDFLPFLIYVYSPIELEVNYVALYESQLQPQGAEYKVLTKFPLN